MRIFGPVPSRRLGYSLGVDPVDFKRCTLDCIYCQLGPTARKTVERKVYAPPEEILEELGKKLEEGGRIDWITLSGSGEPTLHSGIGGLIRSIKKMTGIPVAVLTNGTLLCNPRVREDLAAADLVVPSLDAGTEETFRRVNRPHQDILLGDLVRGMEEFSRSFQGELWLEVMLVKGINDGREELESMAPLIRRIGPDKIQLNTVERPPASEEAKPLTARELREARLILEALLPGIPVEAVTAFSEEGREAMRHDVEESILAYLERRPATVEDLSASLGLHRNEVVKYLECMCRSGRISRRERGKKGYFIRGDGGPLKNVAKKAGRTGRRKSSRRDTA